MSFVYIGLALICIAAVFFFFNRRSKKISPPVDTAQISISPTEPVVESKEVVAFKKALRPRISKAISSWIPLFQSKSKDAQQWEEVLIESDMGPKLTSGLLAEMKDSSLEPKDFLKQKLTSMIEGADQGSNSWLEKKPWVVFLVGVNGVGKTTTIVKLAHYFRSQGLKCGVVAADTFRKAATEQLERGCQKVRVDFFTIQGSEASEGADPGAVIFDGLRKFADRDVILVDTSGRLHTKKNLMEELKKIVRVADKSLNGSPHDIWMIIDATLGQNATQQAKAFHEAVPLSGLVLTKMDGLSRGGTIFQLFQELHVPIRFLGLGESVEDLEVFNSSKFVEELFDQAPASS